MSAEGHGPTEFFYGLHQLECHGWKTEILEDAEIGMSPPLIWPARVLNKASRFLGGFPLGMAISLFRPRVYQKLNRADVIVATTTGLGLVMALGKMVGILHRPIVFLAMGVLPARPSRIQKAIIPPLLCHVVVVTISRGDQAVLKEILSGQEILYIPFGVDGDFWHPGPPQDSGTYVLAIGNDPHRDWDTLVAAWSSHLPPLKIITTLPVPSAAPNVEVIRGDWRSEVLCDDEIRALYHGAQFVVVPLRETSQPSGQSVCLQAMACGKAVILSDISGVWDRSLMKDRETVMLVPPGNCRALRSVVQELISNSGLRMRIAAGGRRIIEEHLNVNNMAAALASVIEQAHG